MEFIQEIRNINLADLKLWSENPRDPIYNDVKDDDIIELALTDRHSKWELNKLNNSMGDYYDFSELPVVVFHNNIPVVYDGNRRVILGKIKNGIFSRPANISVRAEFPKEIPCNVCDQATAVLSVYRKHAESGTWKPLERDVFAHNYLDKPRTFLMCLEDQLKFFSMNPHMNQGFVKDEIFNSQKLRSLGLSYADGVIKSKHSPDETIEILNDISNKVKNKIITTRVSRGDVFGVLSPEIRKKIDLNKNNNEEDIFNKKIPNRPKPSEDEKAKVAKRVKNTKTSFFNGKIYIRSGKLNNLYRDITDLCSFYEENKNRLSDSFCALIRMSLRLLAETAASEDACSKLDLYVKKYFSIAKQDLNQDIRTLLSTHNVTETSIVQLLHTGAHNYTSSSNIEQTIAISIILGKMLEKSHK